MIRIDQGEFLMDDVRVILLVLVLINSYVLQG
jgi:hypothetical protein